MMNKNHSEVVRLRQQIELECQAMQRALHGPAMVASHDLINHKFGCIGLYQDQLEQLVGETQAALFMVETYKNTMG